MAKFLFRIILLFCFLLKLTSVSAQDTIKKRKIKVLPVPAFGYSPETKTYIGAVSLFTLNLYDDSLTRSSNAKIEFNYTWNKQIITELEWNYFFKEEKWFTHGFVHYSKYPDKYYGIGSSTQPEDETFFESYRVRLDLEVLKNVKDKLFVGLDTRHLNYFKFSGSQDSIVYDELRTESRTGLGWIVQNDTRDNLLTPTKGSFLKFSNNYNFGSSNYSQLIVDGRKYFNWGKKTQQVVSTRLYTKHIFGIAPFYDLSLIGGDRLARGYFFGRFRDNNLTTFQVEYRALLFWRIGIAAFGGTTLVYNDFTDFNSSTLKPNGGIGLRFLVDKEEGTNLRFDYAVGLNGESGFYVSFGESF